MGQKGEALHEPGAGVNKRSLLGKELELEGRKQVFLFPN